MLKVNLAKGDEVQVIGSKVKFENADVLLVRGITTSAAQAMNWPRMSLGGYFYRASREVHHKLALRFGGARLDPENFQSFVQELP
jgi:hypothetical protein